MAETVNDILTRIFCETELKKDLLAELKPLVAGKDLVVCRKNCSDILSFLVLNFDDEVPGLLKLCRVVSKKRRSYRRNEPEGRSRKDFEIRRMELFDYLFSRSVVFRKLCVENIVTVQQIFMHSSLESLEKLVLLMSKWAFNNDPLIAKFCDTLKDRLKLLKETRRNEEKRGTKSIIEDRILRSKIKKYLEFKTKHELGILSKKSQLDEAMTVCDQIDSAMELLVSFNTSGNAEAVVEAPDKNASFTVDLKIKETSENYVIFQQIREHVLLLKKKYVPWLEEYLRLMSFDSTNASEIVKEFDDIGLFDSEHFDNDVKSTSRVLDRVSVVFKKCQDFGITSEHDNGSAEEEEDDDEFVEVNPDLTVVRSAKKQKEPKSVAEKKRRLESSEKLAGFSVVSGANDSTLMRDDAHEDPLSLFYQNKADKNKEYLEKTAESVSKTTIDDKTKELLGNAPVVEYDDDLFYWDKDEMQFNQAGSGIPFSHRFYGEGTGERTVPKSTLDNLRKRKVIYKKPDEPEHEVTKEDETSSAPAYVHPVMRPPESKPKGSVVERLKKKLNSAEAKRRIDNETSREFEQRLRNRQVHRF